jgi:hypothetical protein
MEYTREQLDAAFAADEVARYGLMAGQPQRPAYSELELARGVLEQPAEPVTSEDVDSAVAELSALRREDYSLTYEQVRSLAGGERDLDSLAAGIVELARSDPGEVQLAATISAEDRRALADRGHALEDGSYPIPDKSHLRAAAVLAASGHGNVKAARALIRKRAGELGVDLESLPGFGSSGGEEEEGHEDEEEERGSRRRRRGQNPTPESRGVGTEAASGDVAAARRWARAGVVSLSAGDEAGELELAGSAGGGPLEDIQNRHPEYFGGERPRNKGRRAETRVEDEEPRDRRQPHQGGETHPEVERLLREMKRASGREAPHGSVQVHRPRASQRASAG